MKNIIFSYLVQLSVISRISGKVCIMKRQLYLYKMDFMSCCDKKCVFFKLNILGPFENLQGL